MKMRHFLCLCVLGSVVASPVAAENTKTPYWASIRSEEVNLRVGPGEDYRINWVYHRQHLPLKIIRLKDGWRLVQDSAGNQGWMLSRFLTRERGAVVIGVGLADMRGKGDPAARLLWRMQPGVVGLLGDCSGGWCGFSTAGRRGYVQQSRLWGAGEP